MLSHAVVGRLVVPPSTRRFSKNDTEVGKPEVVENAPSRYWLSAVPPRVPVIVTVTTVVEV
uniref:Uncharacterized protein n=1 Tax=uncultured marine virus TaxID=186617 RepID=A0A0F7L509_9VIRU|nr:hypothetical protein [uncultured marine virus]